MVKKQIEKDKLYKVTPKERVEVLNKKLYPGRSYYLLGKHLQSLVDQGADIEWQPDDAG